MGQNNFVGSNEHTPWVLCIKLHLKMPGDVNFSPFLVKLPILVPPLPEKRKCKMEIRTNTKLISWEIIAWNILRNLSIAAETSKKKDVQYCSPPLKGVPHAAVGGGALPGAPSLPLPCLHHQLPPLAVQPSGFKRFEPKLCRVSVGVQVGGPTWGYESLQRR